MNIWIGWSWHWFARSMPNIVQLSSPGSWIMCLTHIRALDAVLSHRWVRYRCYIFWSTNCPSPHHLSQLILGCPRIAYCWFHMDPLCRFTSLTRYVTHGQQMSQSIWRPLRIPDLVDGVLFGLVDSMTNNDTVSSLKLLECQSNLYIFALDAVLSHRWLRYRCCHILIDRCPSHHLQPLTSRVVP
jgi:hypothetical protein